MEATIHRRISCVVASKVVVIASIVAHGLLVGINRREVTVAIILRRLLRRSGGGRVHHTVGIHLQHKKLIGIVQISRR